MAPHLSPHVRLWERHHGGVWLRTTTAGTVRSWRAVAANAIVMAVALVGVGCHTTPAETGARAPGWHPVAAPPAALASTRPLWVSGELVFFDGVPTDGHGLAYLPEQDTWRSVASPPAAGPEIGGWAMASTGTQIVAVSPTAAAVYTPKSDTWRSLPGPPPAPQVLGATENEIASLVWTGREVALAYRLGDGLAALDVLRGRWRKLPATGFGGSQLLATGAGLVMTGTNFERHPSTHLLLPGSEQWRPLPDMPPQMYPNAVAGSSVVASGLRPGTNDHEGGRYVLPEGRWEPLPPAPVSAYAGVSVADGGIVALWLGSASGRPERPDGALIRPGGDHWEVIPPPPQRVSGGALVAAGDDFLLLDVPSGPGSSPRLVVRYHPPRSPGPGPEAIPTAAPTGVCPASSFTARTGGNRGSRGTNYTVFLTNRSDEVCTLRGPTEITAADDGGAPISFPDGRSADEGPALTALPDVATSAEMALWMHWGTSTGPQRRRPECVDAPIAGHLFVSWPGAGGAVEIELPTSPGDRLPICNAEVFPFRDAWPTW
jgi:hypothetical protein